MKYKDITGQTFGELTAKFPIGRNSRNAMVWQYECTCGALVDKVAQDITSRAGRGGTPSCGCALKGINSKNWRGTGEIPKDYINNIIRGAKTRNLEFSVTPEYIWDLFILQSKKCALTGVELSFGPAKKSRDGITASLDRIDSSKVYIEGNVQWVHKKINQIKMDLQQEEFIELCRKVVGYQEVSSCGS